MRTWAIIVTLLLTPILASPRLPGSTALADQLTWDQRVINLLEQIIIVLEDVRAEITCEYPPYYWGQAMAMHGQLDQAIGRIDGLLDPTSETSLSSSADVGSVDDGFHPQSIHEYAKLCVNLAHAAAAETSRGIVMDVDLIGTHLKTIRHLVERSGTHNFHSMIDDNTLPSDE